MNKYLAIYNELSAAAAHVFSEGIDATVGSYTLSELANIGNYKKAPKTHSLLYFTVFLTI